MPCPLMRFELLTNSFFAFLSPYKNFLISHTKASFWDVASCVRNRIKSFIFSVNVNRNINQNISQTSVGLYSGAGRVHTDFVQTNHVCVTSEHCLDCFSDLILCHQDTSLWVIPVTYCRSVCILMLLMCIFTFSGGTKSSMNVICKATKVGCQWAVCYEL